MYLYICICTTAQMIRSRSSRHVRTMGSPSLAVACGASGWNSDTVSVLCRERFWVVVDLKRRYRNRLNEWMNEDIHFPKESWNSLKSIESNDCSFFYQPRNFFPTRKFLLRSQWHSKVGTEWKHRTCFVIRVLDPAVALRHLELSHQNLVIVWMDYVLHLRTQDIALQSSNREEYNYM